MPIVKHDHVQRRFTTGVCGPVLVGSLSASVEATKSRGHEDESWIGSLLEQRFECISSLSCASDIGVHCLHDQVGDGNLVQVVFVGGDAGLKETSVSPNYVLMLPYTHWH